MTQEHETLLEEYPITVRLPVHWGDMDAYQHVNNVVYFRWFETARVSYFDAMHIMGDPAVPVRPILASVQCRYKAPLLHPDVVVVGARVDGVQEDRFRMSYAVVSEALARVAAVGEGLVVSFDYAAGHKVALPAAWRESIASIEARASHDAP
ncbi:MAG: thioesterase family protein [Pseudomonadota bacterium]